MPLGLRPLGSGALAQGPLTVLVTVVVPPVVEVGGHGAGGGPRKPKTAQRDTEPSAYYYHLLARKIQRQREEKERRELAKAMAGEVPVKPAPVIALDKPAERDLLAELGLRPVAAELVERQAKADRLTEELKAAIRLRQQNETAALLLLGLVPEYVEPINEQDEAALLLLLS